MKDYQKSNLDVTTYRNGDIIPEVTDAKEWKKLKTGAWCYYNNDPINGISYGKLYNWYAVNDPRGLAPEGYHIPDDKEMDSLNLFDNQTLGGSRDYFGTFTTIGSTGLWWSSSETNTPNAWTRTLNYYNGTASSYNPNKKFGFSVRCLRDADTLKCKDSTCIEDIVDIKQETLEEAAEMHFQWTTNDETLTCKDHFIEGAKWQQERSYSEEEVKNAFLDGWQLRDGDLPFPKAKKEWFEKFKK